MEKTQSKESFICDNINDLNIQYRKEILQIIYNSQFRNKLKEKGNGTQIKIYDLDTYIINKIHTFMVQKLDNQQTHIL